MSALQFIPDPLPQPSPNDLYRAAQRLIKAGQPIFPCRSVSVDDRHKAKAPLTTNGVNDAVLDIRQAKAWWQRNPSASIGIATGVKWDVLDVDVKKHADGRAHLPYLAHLGLLNGCKRMVKTPSGGWHLYFLSNQTIGNKGKAASIGLDVRGKGGYVLAPPSWIDTTEELDGGYSGAYVDMGEPDNSTNDPLMWDQIVWALAPFGVDKDTKQPRNLLPSDRQASVAALREWVSILQSGERNNGLFWAISRCIENSIDPYELFDAALLTGLTEGEIRFTMDEALKRAELKAEDLMTEVEAMFPDLDDDE